MKLSNFKYLTYMNNEIRKLICKDIAKKILFMFGVYTFAIISIIRADFLYHDDFERIFYGNRIWRNNSRYIDDFLAIFLHADTLITDISPLPQLIAALLIAIASVLLVYIIYDGKVTKTACFLALPVGLNPYILQCFSFKFDAPYMGLSVLISIVPFLFTQNNIVFSLSSIISLLIMCMTYQASSGIYIILVIILCFKAWNERRKTGREIIRFVVISAASYCVSMIFFRLFLMRRQDTYISTDVFPIQKLFSGIANNFISYMNFVNADFGIIWKFLLFILCLTFILASVLLTKRNKIAALALSLAVVIAMCVMSFGVYLALTRPLFQPRAMYGFGIFIACVAVYLSGVPKKIVLLPAALLYWCFFVFSLTYGNALSEQKKYNTFRTEILLHDISRLFPDRAKGLLRVRLVNSEGFVPSVHNIAKRNPVIRRLVPLYLDGEEWIWASFQSIRHYEFNLYLLYDSIDIEDDKYKVILDTYYHTLKTDGKVLLVILKNGYYR